MLNLIRRNLEDKKHEIVHIHAGFSPTCLGLISLLNKFKVPYVVQLHGESPRKIPVNLYTYFLTWHTTRNASRILYVNKNQRDWLVTVVGIPTEKCVFLPNAVDINCFKKLDPAEGLLNFNLTPSVKYVLYVGRLDKNKGVHHLIRAFKIVNQINENTHLLIVGNGKYKSKLEHTFRKYE
jgi:glycosyltransferase involved in cell wall biosynthesis